MCKGAPSQEHYRAARVNSFTPTYLVFELGVKGFPRHLTALLAMN